MQFKVMVSLTAGLHMGTTFLIDPLARAGVFGVAALLVALLRRLS